MDKKIVLDDGEGHHHEYFECVCTSNEHTLRISYFDGEDFDELYVSIHLNPIWPWYKRVYHAIRYIFGYHCKYGHFEEASLGPTTAKRLRDLLEKFIKEQESLKD